MFTLYMHFSSNLVCSSTGLAKQTVKGTYVCGAHVLLGYETSQAAAQSTGAQDWAALSIRFQKEILYSEGGEAWHRLPREAVDVPSLEVF